MKKNETIKKIWLVIIVICMTFSTSIALADDGEGEEDFPDDVDDEPGGPINDWIPVALVAAAFTGYYLIRKQQKLS
jgi:hypothetical protein